MQDMSPYTPPKVWQDETELGGKWGSLNRPEAGARYEKALPTGEQPLQLYSLATPNGIKIGIMLEELLAAGHQDAGYDAHLIDISAGEQFSSGFVNLNPNSKIPALLDISTTPATKIFESGAILLYLAEKFNAFIPTNHHERAKCLSWLFWQVGSAPYLGGGFGHFYHYAPIKIEYGINRFTIEVKRQLDLLDQQFAHHRYICGEAYTIADMAIFPWYGGLVLGQLYDAAEFLDTEQYINVKRWANEIMAREPVQRGRLVTSQSA